MNKEAFHQSASSGFESPQDSVIPVDAIGRRGSDPIPTSKVMSTIQRFSFNNQSSKDGEGSVGCKSKGSSNSPLPFSKAAHKGFHRPDGFIGSPQGRPQRGWKAKRVIDSESDSDERPRIGQRLSAPPLLDAPTEQQQQQNQAEHDMVTSAHEQAGNSPRSTPAPRTKTRSSWKQKSTTGAGAASHKETSDQAAFASPGKKGPNANLRRLQQKPTSPQVPIAATSEGIKSPMKAFIEKAQSPSDPTTPSTDELSSINSPRSSTSSTRMQRAANASSSSLSISPPPLSGGTSPAQVTPSKKRWTPAKVGDLSGTMIPPAFRASFSKTVGRPPLTPKSKDAVAVEPTKSPEPLRRKKSTRRPPTKLKSTWPPTTAKANVSAVMTKRRIKEIIKPQKPVKLITTTIEKEIKQQVVHKTSDDPALGDNDGDHDAAASSSIKKTTSRPPKHQRASLSKKTATADAPGVASAKKVSKRNSASSSATSPLTHLRRTPGTQKATLDADADGFCEFKLPSGKTLRRRASKLVRHASLQIRYGGPTLLPIDELYDRHVDPGDFDPDQLDSRFLTDSKLHDKPPTRPMRLQNGEWSECDEEENDQQLNEEDAPKEAAQHEDEHGEVYFENLPGGLSKPKTQAKNSRKAVRSSTAGKSKDLKDDLTSTQPDRPHLAPGATRTAGAAAGNGHNDDDEASHNELELDRPDIWVTPLKGSDPSNRVWRVKRVWGIPELDCLEPEHEVDDADLFDEIRALLGVPLDGTSAPAMGADRNWHVKKVYDVDGIIDDSVEEASMADEDLLVGFQILSEEASIAEWEDSMNSIQLTDDVLADIVDRFPDSFGQADSDSRSASFTSTHGHRAYCRPDDWVSPQEGRKQKKSNSRTWKVKKVWDVPSPSDEDASPGDDSARKSASLNPESPSPNDADDQDDRSIGVDDLCAKDEGNADLTDSIATASTQTLSAGSKSKKKRKSKSGMQISDLLSPPPVFEMSFTDST